MSEHAKRQGTIHSLKEARKKRYKAETRMRETTRDTDGPAGHAPDPVGAAAQRKIALRLLPVIAIGYGLAYMDRVNISFASPGR